MSKFLGKSHFKKLLYERGFLIECKFLLDYQCHPSLPSWKARQEVPRACTTMKCILKAKKEKINKRWKAPHQQQARFHTVTAKKVSEIIFEMLILYDKKMTLLWITFEVRRKFNLKSLDCYRGLPVTPNHLQLIDWHPLTASSVKCTGYGSGNG